MAMDITRLSRGPIGAPWLVFMFMLPTHRASQRVNVWRKLRRFGTLPWKKSAHILPNNHANLEKFQWLAAEVRKYKGESSILRVTRIEGTTDDRIIAMFNDARSKDYELLVRDLRLALRDAASRSKVQFRRAFTRLNQRLREIVEVDTFGCREKKKADVLLKEVEARLQAEERPSQNVEKKRRGFTGRDWMTRPRPGVDRVSSAWLIRNFIDPEARFVFSSDPQAQEGAIRFDMFEGEFTHVGDDCTFETLIKRFDLRNPQLRLIAQLVHDADMGDNKFGHAEGKGVDLILRGWSQSDWPDSEILKRGFDLFDALYLTVDGKRHSMGVKGRGRRNRGS